MKMRATLSVVLEYDADPARYGANEGEEVSAEIIAQIDKEGFEQVPEILIDRAPESIKVTVVPIE